MEITTNFYLFLILLFPFTGKSQNTVGTLLNTEYVEEGYVLFEFLGDTSIYLIDNCGQVVNRWESDFTAGTSVYLLDDGSIVRAGKTPMTSFTVGGQGGVLEKFDWDGNLMWQYFYSNEDHSLHHDFEVMPNGNILAIAFEHRDLQEIIESGKDTSLLTIDELWPETIIELQPIGFDSAKIVWEWKMWDHLIQDYDSTKFNYGLVKEHPELFNINFQTTTIADWAHANSIDYNATLDQIVLSLNFFNEFIIIDHSTTTFQASTNNGGNSNKGGDLLYRYGNPEAYGRGDSTNRVNFSQHNVHWIPNGLRDEGKIMFFNNGSDRPIGLFSSIEIINPLVDENGDYILEADTTFGPDNPEWVYTSTIPTDFFSPIVSGAQRLPNGNTLICEGKPAHFFEIDSAKNTVWSYQSPITSGRVLAQGDSILGNRIVFNTRRYLPSFPGLIGKDLTPDLPIELNPDISECITVAITKYVEKGIEFYPNPVGDYLRINWNETNYPSKISIYDIYGQLVVSKRYNSEIYLGDLRAGVYLLMISGRAERIVKQ